MEAKAGWFKYAYLLLVHLHMTKLILLLLLMYKLQTPLKWLHL